MNLVVKGGEVLSPEGKAGLADLTGGMMTQGTETRDAIKLASELSEIGASLGGVGGGGGGRRGGGGGGGERPGDRAASRPAL